MRDGDVVAGDDAHHQPRAGAGVAEIDWPAGLGKPAHAAPQHLPDVADLRDGRAERGHGAAPC